MSALNNNTLNDRLAKVLSKYDPIPKVVVTKEDGSQIERDSIPEDADLFAFNFTKDGENYGRVTVSLDNAKTLKIGVNDKVADSPDVRTPGLDYDDTWTGFLETMKTWALNNQLSFDVKNISHLHDELARRKRMEKKEKVSESYHAMGKKASYNDAVPSVKIVLQHSKVMQEGEQRFRHIEKIFVENAQGERFLLPTNKPGLARVFARHIAEGGTPYDERAGHIQSLVEDYTKMAGFVRATRNGQFNESAQQLVQEGINHYQSLRETLNKLTGRRGYTAYFESWTPALMEEGDLTSVNELFVRETMDPRIESVMPILSRIHNKVSEAKETVELEEWADDIINEKMVFGADTDASTGGTVYREAEEGIQSNNPIGIPEDEGMDLNQLATISDKALDDAYHYGRSSPGNSFGWQANLKSAEFAKKAIESGITDIEAIADAIHKGWNVTAKAFVSNPDQFGDTEKLRAAGKLDAKLAQRQKLMSINYAQLPDEEQEKDRVVARALLQALTGGQGVEEGAKVDRMVKHIAKSERKLGKSKEEAENIAWATANKRGMLDNKNKKEDVTESAFRDMKLLSGLSKQDVMEDHGGPHWQEVVSALAQGYPDLDPTDSLAPLMRKYGVSFDELDKLAQQNGYRDVYAAMDDFADEEGMMEGYEDRKNAPSWHSDSVKNPNFNDELSGRRVSAPGKRLKSGKLSADERGSQERTKALIKFKQKQGGLTGPKGKLPEEVQVNEELFSEAIKAYQGLIDKIDNLKKGTSKKVLVRTLKVGDVVHHPRDKSDITIITPDHIKAIHKMLHTEEAELDEAVEVTPKSVRLRKVQLDASERARQRKKKVSAAT